jgi:hypothetical protein
VIFDDTIMDKPLDTASYHFQTSDELDEWREVFSRKLGQKHLVDFFKRRPDGEVEDLESLIAKLQKMKLVTEIVGDYQYDDRNNVSFFFKSKDGEGSVALPTMFLITIPLLNESEYKATIEVELELVKPKSEDEKPEIVLTCPKLSRYIKEATKYEVNRMNEELEGYLILVSQPYSITLIDKVSIRRSIWIRSSENQSMLRLSQRLDMQ